jgi:hypothetical protein
MRPLVTHGNLKLGKDTLIFNITSAHNCVSNLINKCKIPEGKCYAKRIEVYRKHSKGFHEQQTMFWDVLPAWFIALNLRLVASRKKEAIKYIRVNECGDFRSQGDVEKLKNIASYLPYTIYCYTARDDLKFKNLPDNLVVNGTGFKVDNKINIITDKKWHKYACPGDCRYCSMCKSKNGLDIGLVLH